MTGGLDLPHVSPALLVQSNERALRRFPVLTFPRGEDSESRASLEADLQSAQARPLLGPS